MKGKAFFLANLTKVCYSQALPAYHIDSAVTLLIKLLFSLCFWKQQGTLVEGKEVGVFLSVSPVSLLCNVYVCLCVSSVWRMTVCRLLCGGSHCSNSCSVYPLRDTTAIGVCGDASNYSAS